MFTLNGHTLRIVHLAFSPDGTKLATGGLDTTAKIWDAHTGELLLTLRGHRATIIKLEFNADGTRLATASNDGTARIWDLTTGQELLTLTSRSGRLDSAHFSPDGNYLATVNAGEAKVRVYTLQIEELIALAKSRVTRPLTTEECQRYLHVEACP